MAFKFWLLCIAMFIVVIVERNCLLFLQHRRYKINLFLNFLKTVFDQITLKYAENFANCFVRFKSVANHVHVQWTRILNHPYSTRSSHRVRDLSVNFLDVRCQDDVKDAEMHSSARSIRYHDCSAYRSLTVVVSRWTYVASP